ncbi:hypothetical protein [Nevskia soli]|uniref:hypothetical protein n=1 Tax=Nevskia soli TaxID=418856 RepID=UPI0012FBF444|nr:hypothetical protein [Nevskia soli]
MDEIVNGISEWSAFQMLMPRFGKSRAQREEAISQMQLAIDRILATKPSPPSSKEIPR